MCKATGGEGDIAMIEAIEIPVLLPRWNVFLETIKAKCPKLKVVAIERAISDDAATARPERSIECSCGRIYSLELL
jgi:hypothetical protein